MRRPAFNRNDRENGSFYFGRNNQALAFRAANNVAFVVCAASGEFTTKTLDGEFTSSSDVAFVDASIVPPRRNKPANPGIIRRFSRKVDCDRGKVHNCDAFIVSAQLQINVRFVDSRNRNSVVPKFDHERV